MRDGTRLLVTLLVAVGLALPAGAAGAVTNGTSATDATEATTTAQASNETQVNVTAGAQLSTVLAATESEVTAEFEESAFEAEYESADAGARAEAIADRAESLRERATEIREDYREATEAYQEGEITRDQYAQRLATLNARAGTVVDGYDRLQQRAANVSALELRAAGYNETAAREAVRSLDNVSGTGASALLERFTGQSEGEVEIETENGFAVSVTSEDGEQSREFERPGDDDTSLDVNQSVALSTARAALTETNGSWDLQRASIDREDGVYEFQFRLDVNDSSGEAEVAVDGSSGEILSLEDEIERADDEDEEREDEAENEEREDKADEEDEERDLALVVAGGTVNASETITVRALADGEPVENVAVSLNGEPVGETNADGELNVTLAARGEVELTAGEEGELEFDLGEEEDEVIRKFATEASLEDGTVTVTVSYDGDAVRNATMYANDETVGTTDADGTVSFDLGNETEELELEIVKGAFETELEYTIDSGTLTLVESEHEGDGDHAEERETEESDEEETEAEDADDEEAETEDDEEMETTEPEEDDEEMETETEEDDEEMETETEEDEDADDEEAETEDDEEMETETEEDENADDEETEPEDDEETETEAAD